MNERRVSFATLFILALKSDRYTHQSSLLKLHVLLLTSGNLFVRLKVECTMSSEANLKKLWESHTLPKAKLPDLKAYLKSVGLPMTGELTAIAKRVEMYMDVKFMDLFVMQDGKKATPFELKPVQLRKIVAQLGMDPTGDKDELHSSLIGHLKSKSKNDAGDGAGKSNSNEPQGVILAKQILEMHSDYPSILSASGINITTDSSVATMRKAYLKLSLLIHPDKLQSAFPDATKAFQCLVNAYERMSQPELFLEEEDDKKKKKVMRSNDGCHRTDIFCPRCKSEWGLPASGVEPYDYNFLMMGLRTYNCALCLFDYGCMTAVHVCPFCKKEFDYHPDDYHRKIKCSNAKCSKHFGFFMFNISERREREYMQEIREKREKILKDKEQLAERERRAQSRQSKTDPHGKEKLFIMNLLDQCPRCGEEMDEDSFDVRFNHLKGCTNKAKIAAYAKRLKEEQEASDAKRKLQEMEEEVQNIQSWEYLGGKTSEMWLLSENQLRKMCESYKLDGTGSKEELIARVVRHRNALDSKRMLTDGGEAGAPPSKKMKITLQDLPKNLESMSLTQLKCVCASFGITPKNTKDRIINQLETLVHGKEQMLQITDGSGKK
ncbi:hypothetical protein Bhyg_16788 [Pseudolycoriella hygida]|uniref:Uncharacterized protein n=1 Tax=Pseudolycoriella hygida TaxID=35572 RepID=A0A9Q0MN02_9DIPT|nr:hypothetical protein Bhyg_16788 [Pseudolycoriella hygida]